ncbi:hypothetical protein A0H81_10701 [Grifola frondosa]|uniref:Uncharacterized protein n=1 Tax=Grifola frondosa TaxID=5627 RepID=A0A1C7M230_GRIFR|nr:hypothetical protein A0H81_10701 [Grifola frondosa]
MLQDIIELRERKWVPHNQVAALTTIAAVHEAAAKEKAATEKDAYQRNLSMSRGGSRRGGERGEHGQTWGCHWELHTMAASQGGIFAGKKETKQESRGSMNMFLMLSQNPKLAVEPAALSKTSRSPSQKASIDLGQSGVPEAPAQRRKLNLLPRMVQKSDEAKADATPAASTVNLDDEDSEAPTSSMMQAEVEA